MPIRTEPVMGTLVTIHAVASESAAEAAIDRAFGWFHEIEARCTRFDKTSELMQLCARSGVAVPVSAILFEAVRFAVAVAEETGGAFDPTLGDRMMRRGFDREFRTGERVRAAIADPGEAATYRDIALDCDQRTIALRRPMLLDLGAVAKGLAVDMATRELAPFRDFAIDAGGDLYLGGANAAGAPWSVGIRHPRGDGELIDCLQITNRAVCTSGDYERPVPVPGHDGEHHIIDPRSGDSPQTAASVTVIAPGAMLADALATAAFVLGPEEGIRLLERMGVEGLIVTPALERYQTQGLRDAA